jgi:hypothetical protein
MPPEAVREHSLGSTMRRRTTGLASILRTSSWSAADGRSPDRSATARWPRPAGGFLKKVNQWLTNLWNPFMPPGWRSRVRRVGNERHETAATR